MLYWTSSNVSNIWSSVSEISSGIPLPDIRRWKGSISMVWTFVTTSPQGPISMNVLFTSVFESHFPSSVRMR